MLQRMEPHDAVVRCSPLDSETVRVAQTIVDDVRRRGWAAAGEYARQHDGWNGSDRLAWSRDDLQAKARAVPPETFDLLRRTADRIRASLPKQHADDADREVAIAGGRAGMRRLPLRAGGLLCPRRAHPLVSSLLMTCVTARGGGRVGLDRDAATRPAAVHAAELAEVDGLLALGGAQAIAALAYGLPGVDRCDVVVGPGNRWVTAAKWIVSADVKIDMLAGPSELLVVAGEEADPRWVAADLLAQAEHDREARPMLAALSASMIDRIEQLAVSGGASGGGGVLGSGLGRHACWRCPTAIELARRLAAEHLAWHAPLSDESLGRIRCCGTLFIGVLAEVLGDYGGGPNHVLPTGGTARFASGSCSQPFKKDSDLVADRRLDGGGIAD